MARLPVGEVANKGQPLAASCVQGRPPTRGSRLGKPLVGTVPALMGGCLLVGWPHKVMRHVNAVAAWASTATRGRQQLLAVGSLGAEALPTMATLAHKGDHPRAEAAMVH
ncbi:hypothetical protein GW17_00031000 [Ensete ventricosum]|nr:hypothetical protein GW17_00031000 [Ensete ventricosum]RZS08082.1 hypothetical protein BHM03_00039015 [Ensete ventricosum]